MYQKRNPSTTSTLDCEPTVWVTSLSLDTSFPPDVRSCRQDGPRMGFTSPTTLFSTGGRQRLTNYLQETYVYTSFTLDDYKCPTTLVGLIIKVGCLDSSYPWRSTHGLGDPGDFEKTFPLHNHLPTSEIKLTTSEVSRMTQRSLKKLIPEKLNNIPETNQKSLKFINKND